MSRKAPFFCGAGFTPPSSLSRSVGAAFTPPSSQSFSKKQNCHPERSEVLCAIALRDESAFGFGRVPQPRGNSDFSPSDEFPFSNFDFRISNLFRAIET